MAPKAEDTKNIQLRNGIYQLCYKINGKLIRQTLRTSDLSEARRKRDEILGGLIAQKDEKSLLKTVKRQLAGIEEEEREKRKSEFSGILIADAFRIFEKDPTRRTCQQRAVDNNRSNWMKFVSWLMQNHPEIQFCRQVTREICTEWAGDALRSVAATNTYNHYISSVRYVFTSIVNRDPEFRNPMEVIHKRRDDDCEIKQPFSESELRRIFASPDTEFCRLCAIGLYTTLRFTDSRNVTWDMFDKDLTKLAAVHTKTRTDASLVIPEELRHWLDIVPEKERHGLVCPSYSGNHSKASQLVMAKLQRCGIQTQADKQGLNGKVRTVCVRGFHSFRHTAVTMARQNGANPSQVDRLAWGGGGKGSIMDRYSHLTADDAGKASALIGRFW